MSIKRDLSHLPVDHGTGERALRPPDPISRFTSAIAEEWWNEYRANDVPRPTALPGVAYRASWAGNECLRALGYAITETPTTEPYTLTSVYRFTLGKLVHSLFDGAMERAFPTAYPELLISLEPHVDGAASVDMVIDIPVEESDVKGLVPGSVVDLSTDEYADGITPLPRISSLVESDNNFKRQVWLEEGPPVNRTVLELKSVTGYPFKTSTTQFQGKGPEGPKHSAIVQGALAAYALRAHQLVIGSLCLEPISPSMARWKGVSDSARFSAEWTFERDQYAPYAIDEHIRVAYALQMQAEGTLVLPRTITTAEIPPGNRIEDPVKGIWTIRDGDGNLARTGRAWHCDYCNWRGQCVTDGPT